MSLISFLSSRQCPRRKKLIISLSHPSEQIAWISHTLLQLRRDCPSTLVLDVRIFVTQLKALVNELSRTDTLSSSDENGSSSNEDITPEEGRSSSDSGELNEKMEVAERKAEKLGAELDHSGGRPDFSSLLGSIIKDAGGGAVAVNGESAWSRYRRAG